MLSIAIGALQLMLDRGEQVDWFASAEIWIYLGLVLSGLWAFVLHVTAGASIRSSTRRCSATGTSSPRWC